MTKSLEYEKCLETGGTTKSFEYRKCLETGETTNTLEMITFSRDFAVFLFLDTFEYGKCLETGEATKFLKYGRGLSMESVKKRKIPCVMEKRHRHMAPNDLLDV